MSLWSKVLFIFFDELFISSAKFIASLKSSDLEGKK